MNNVKPTTPFNSAVTPTLLQRRTVNREGVVSGYDWFLYHRGQFYRLSHVLTQPAVAETAICPEQVLVGPAGFAPVGEGDLCDE